MFATTSITRTTRLISIVGALSTGLLMAGCSDDAILDTDAVNDIFNVSTDQSTDTPENTTVDVATEPPVAPPPTQTPVQQPIDDDLSSPPPVQTPINQPVNVENASGSEAFLALRRLQPATQFDYTVTSDGATFSRFSNYSNGLLEDEGEDSTLFSISDTGNTQGCSYLSGTYFCIDIFTDGLGFTELFTLDANNRGSGTFLVCPDFANTLEVCIETLFESPVGTSVVTAGIQTTAFGSAALSDTPLFAGSEYLQHLAQIEPVPTNRSSENLFELTERATNLVNRLNRQ